MKGNIKGSLMLLTTAFIWGTAFVAQSSGMDYIAANAEYLSPYPSAFREKGIRKRDMATMAAAMKNYTLEDVRRIILYLGDMDNAVKTASSELLPIVLSSVIFTITAEKGRETGIDLLSSPLETRI